MHFLSEQSGYALNFPGSAIGIFLRGDQPQGLIGGKPRISDHYDIDLESAHLAARRDEMRYLGREPTF